MIKHKIIRKPDGAGWVCEVCLWIDTTGAELHAAIIMHDEFLGIETHYLDLQLKERLKTQLDNHLALVNHTFPSDFSYERDRAAFKAGAKWIVQSFPTIKELAQIMYEAYNDESAPLDFVKEPDILKELYYQQAEAIVEVWMTQIENDR